MKLFYNKKEIGSVVTNKKLTVEEALYSIGYDVYNQEDLEKAYECGFPASYIDDEGICRIDTENIEIL